MKPPRPILSIRTKPRHLVEAEALKRALAKVREKQAVEAES